MNENILSQINLILCNVPKDVDVIEKVRWLYIKAGSLFSYDYRIMDNPNIIDKEVSYIEDKIDRYQTCLQITEIFNTMLKILEPSCKGSIIVRKLPDDRNDIDHLANAIELENGEKYILDLTLDLYLIQSGCQTKNFGFCTDKDGTYDIIPLNMCKRMDQKLGLLKGNYYTDEKIRRLKAEAMGMNITFENDLQKIDYIVSKIREKLSRNFHGIHEGKRYINKLFSNILEEYSYKEYNLYYKKNDIFNFIACYIFEGDEEPLCYLYSNELGLIRSDIDKINNMLKLGWNTRSLSLNDSIEKYLIKKQIKK